MFRQFFHIIARIIYFAGTCLLAGALNYIQHHATTQQAQLNKSQYA